MERDAAKSNVRDSYERYHLRIDGGEHSAHVRFMNFGYASLPDAAERDRNTVAIPRLLPNAEGARLVGEIIGPESLDDRSVLDVGCGRGGTLWLVARSFTPRRVMGIDLSPAAVAATARTMAAATVPVLATVGDAERLPVATRSIDVVLNVESSLHYPQLERFYAEVARVCRPGGAFCYGDLFSVAAGDAYAAALTAAGFELDESRDITDNVLTARRRRASRQAKALQRFGEPDGGGDAARFVAEPGTAFFTAMNDGTLRYRVLHARRTAQPAGCADPDPRLRAAAQLAADLTGTFAGGHA